jgi:LacI family transcriptional regulator
MTSRVTIREVAKEAGVSIGTASRALNRAGRVSEKAIVAVTKAARKLGYEPDGIAQSMRTRSTGMVGLLVSDIANPLYARMITAAEATFQAAGYALLLASTHNEKSREKSLIDLFRARRVDGMVLGPGNWAKACPSWRLTGNSMSRLPASRWTISPAHCKPRAMR